MDSHQKSDLDSIRNTPPFSFLTDAQFSSWFQDSKLINLSIGERLLRPDEMNKSLFVVLNGSLRKIGILPDSNAQITLEKVGPGSFLGWVNIIRGEPTEFLQASTETKCLELSLSSFVHFVKSNDEFASYFQRTLDIQEAYYISKVNAVLSPLKTKGWRSEILGQAFSSTLNCGFSFSSLKLDFENKNLSYVMSTAHSGSFQPGATIPSDLDPQQITFNRVFPVRVLSIPSSSDSLVSDSYSSSITKSSSTEDLYSLGILEQEGLSSSERYPLIRGNGLLGSVLAVLEMVSIEQSVPFKKDSIKKILLERKKKGKVISIDVIAGLFELLGLSTQLGEVKRHHVGSLEAPAVLMRNGTPIIFRSLRSGKVEFISPSEGAVFLPFDDFISDLDESIKVALPRRNSHSPSVSFGWSWFTPLLKKYKLSLALVFISSLLAQLFGLGVPLILQQIIDKVLSQGNLSSLNVLGTAMVVMALFQGILTSLRTFVFVDTTDRMDLTLGSAVIDRLLALPLSYFDKRPVGELSQRLGELNTIRSFLTGTALISVLNILFASLYLVVMIIYSPLLSVVALSTFPLYILLVFGVAPIYKSLIRKKAVAQARTQSHLIEIIGGIQTVKAQHFELTARWKWQDRYKEFVNQGFKSVVLGGVSGEIGSFLNQLSGLLILWVGMWLVLKGEFTLGQLIAFRIIAGNVTSPLLQLAGLYQGFQGVQLSMERLSDIVDQASEAGPDDVNQIVLPPIKGNVIFENVAFRFASKGPYQLDNVSLDIPQGHFVGIVGQSGSGKSTLMKLLPRLYSPESGKILIDDFDISKVELASIRRQIGIVPQDSLLFEGSIAQNIALNDPEAGTEAIIEAAKIACAHDFIMDLSEGYSTKISERGSNLSGGQRQRLAIARTVLSNPQLLVLDEATSALDYSTENELCNRLQSWSKGKTVFFITHRLSTIRNSDLIVLMEKGRIAEKGTHSELMSLNGLYSSLYNQQGYES